MNLTFRRHLPPPEEEAEELLARAHEAADIDRAAYRHHVFREIMLGWNPPARDVAFAESAKLGRVGHPNLLVRETETGGVLERGSYGPARWVHYPVGRLLANAILRRGYHR